MQKAQKQAKIEAEGTNPRKRLFFNAFATNTELIPGFYALSFCFANGSDVLDDYFCIIHREAIVSLRESYLRFLSDFESMHGSEVDFPPLYRPKQVDSADFMGLARHGDQGEIILHSFSWKVTLDRMKQSEDQEKPSRATFVALLRCPIHILKKFILDICDDSHLPKPDSRRRQ